MSRFHSYLSSAVKIIETHGKAEPLAHHLKRFFSADKKYGSRDRKIISALCYNYYRLGHALPQEPVEKRILSGLFLCESKRNELLQSFSPDLEANVGLPLEEKLTILQVSPKNIFAYSNELSGIINKDSYCLSLLKQPHLYLRIRPGEKQIVLDKLNASGILYSLTGEDCILLKNATPIDKILAFDREVVIQDYNSQKVFESHDLKNFNGYSTAWDCCAASGGKSILLYDILNGRIELTVSDIRPNILANLDIRLKRAGIKLKKKFTADLSGGIHGDDKFSIIVCDAPCTGSGTWSRTPEQISFFQPSAIENYSTRQKRIVQNVTGNLEPAGLFFYITCSVFKKENEEVVDFIQKKCNLRLLEMKYLEGYEIQADTLFVAVFTT